jgi:phage shock protein A
MKVFSTFREAAAFAADHCRANRCTAQLLRQESGWTVTTNAAIQAPEPGHQAPEPRYQPSEEDLAREREKAVERKRRREVQELADWHEHREQSEKQRTELMAKRDEVLALARRGSLSHEQLSLVVDNHGMYGFSESELDELLESQRQVRPGQVPSMCPSCHMVGSNCTCGRSWF